MDVACNQECITQAIALLAGLYHITAVIEGLHGSKIARNLKHTVYQQGSQSTCHTHMILNCIMHFILHCTRAYLAVYHYASVYTVNTPYSNQQTLTRFL